MDQLTAERTVPEARHSRRRLVLVSLGIGALLAYLWSFHLADDLIGTNGTSAIVGYDAGKTSLTGAFTISQTDLSEAATGVSFAPPKTNVASGSQPSTHVVG